MNLYTINSELLTAILDAMDPDTGEVIISEHLAELQMAKEEKLEGYALYIKGVLAEAEAIKAEEATLASRRKALEKTALSLKNALIRELPAGEKITTPRVSITWRKSQSVEVLDVYALPIDYLRLVDPVPDKTALKKALKAGETFDGVTLTDNQSIQIK